MRSLGGSFSGFLAHVPKSMVFNRDPDGPNNARSSSWRARAASCRRESDRRFSSFRRAFLSSGSAPARASPPSERERLVAVDAWSDHHLWTSPSSPGTIRVDNMYLQTRTAKSVPISATPRLLQL
ncbi:hypothetical protein BDN71DRAFT_1239679 [Pleurotus eryngii]|uniref:Uncharacterized protein n=1 Tax=Pleurotus eryngii TaxID=5323 RepID=A0A9P6DE25_PLEER|nr:hypothetical protein BDN71DRAFT_1239679 [Pleurotus eryngii]